MKIKQIKNKYLKKVSRNIQCSKKTKQNFLNSLSNSIDDILLENTTIPFDELKNILGEPEEVAKEFESTLDFEILHKHKTKKIITIICIILLVSALLIGFYCYLVYGAVEPVYINETPANELL